MAAVMPPPPHIGKVEFEPDKVVFHEGERGNKAYIIQQGEVEIFRGEGDQKRVLAVITAGGVFGELALVDDGPRSASARAVSRTVCTTLDKTRIQQVVKAADPSIQSLLKLMLAIIRNRG